MVNFITEAQLVSLFKKLLKNRTYLPDLENLVAETEVWKLNNSFKFLISEKMLQKSCDELNKNKTRISIKLIMANNNQ